MSDTISHLPESSRAVKALNSNSIGAELRISGGISFIREKRVSTEFDLSASLDHLCKASAHSPNGL